MARTTSLTIRFISIALVLISFTSSRSVAQPVEGVRVTRTGEGVWRIDLEPGYPFHEIVQSDITYSRYTLPAFGLFTEVGLPQIPFTKLTFVIPHGTTLQSKILDQEFGSTYERWKPFLSAPDSQLSPREMESVRPQRELNPVEAAVSISGIQTACGLRFQSVEIFPVLPNRDGVGTRLLKKLSVEVKLENFDPSWLSQMAARKPADCPFIPDVVNPEHAMRSDESSTMSKRATGYAAGQEYIKIAVDRMGVYRIHREDLDTLGVSMSGVNPKLFQLHHRGVQQPLFVSGEDDLSFDSGDYIEFIGLPLNGERGERYDLWSTDNVYWLTWGADTGVRFRTESIIPGGEPRQSSVLKKVHCEEDREYHAGDNDSQSDISDYIAGETWVWKYLLKKDSLIIPVELTGVDTTGGMALLNIRLKGSSVDSSKARISVNGVVVSEIVLQPTGLRTVTVYIPGTLLREGVNRITIHNAVIVDCPPSNPTCTIERFYVDWIDIIYGYRFTSVSGVVQFADTVGTGVFRAELIHFSDSSLNGYNLSKSVKLSDIVSVFAGSDYKMDGRFQSGDEYYIYGESAAHAPKSMIVDVPSNWSSQGIGADYIIISHRAFWEEAQRLATYRERTDGYRVALVDVVDLYDEFNHGIKHPSAIREFLRHAHYNWERPAPTFVVLMGDASWDPKFNDPNSVKVDYIPTWGYPATDNYYVAFDDVRDIVPKINLGRIPCETLTAAKDVVDKIIDYESLPLEHWNKKILMVNGGKEAWEHALFRAHSEYIIRNFLDPSCFDAQRVYRKSEGIISYAELDSIIGHVNDGCLWFNFVGHGGPRIIDVGVDRPELFQTRNKYPFFVTMSCNTAHFAEPGETGLNELFVLARNNGSICSYGTAGRGVIQYDDFLSDKMFEALTIDSIRTFGQITTKGKIGLIGKTSDKDEIARNIVNQYILLGDPATRIPVPLSPELSIAPEGATTTPVILTDNTVATITADVYNDGLCLSDSVEIEIIHEYKAQELSRRRVVIQPFPIRGTVESEIDFRGRTGLNVITITVDPDARVSEGNRTNNSIRIQKNIVPQGVQMILPLDQAVIPASGSDPVDIEFTVSNPSLLPVDANGELLEEMRVTVEVAHDDLFNRLAGRGEASLGKVFTTVTLAIPSSRTYYWRTRLESGSGVHAWSIPRSFTVDREGSTGGWSQETASQLMANDLSGCAVFPDGSIMNTTTGIPLEIVSGGSRNVEIGNFAEIRIQGIDVSPNRRGFNIAVLDRLTGIVKDTTVFDTYWSSSYADDMADYMGRLDSAYLIIIAVKDDARGYPPVLPGGTNITAKLKNMLAEFGANLVDQIQYRGSYALVGIRGQPDRAKEAVDSLSIAVIKDTINVQAVRGIVRTSPIGPVSRYYSITKKDTVPQGTSVTYEVHGVPVDRDTLLMRFDDTAGMIDLGHVDAHAFPYIRLQGELVDSSGRASPSLESWRIQFDSHFPELGVNCQAVLTEHDSVLEGDPISVSVHVVNRGTAVGQNVRVYIHVDREGGSSAWTDSTSIDVIPADGEHRITFQLPTTGRRGRRIFEIEIDPHRHQEEYYRVNNYYSGTFIVSADKERPTMEVLFDGIRIENNDYVSPHPEIRVRLLDNSPLAVTDTASVQMFLDGRRIFLINNPDVNYSAPTEGNEKIVIHFMPRLSNGVHSLAVNGKDASGNVVDTISYQVRFFVSNTSRIDQIYPYPNPTSGSTSFTFRCIGSAPPDGGSIKIYTVAGRLIRELDIPAAMLTIGFNKVDWDGRDEDGELVGNGLYFYRLQVRRGGGEESYIDKIAVIR